MLDSLDLFDSGERSLALLWIAKQINLAVLKKTAPSSPSLVPRCLCLRHAQEKEFNPILPRRSTLSRSLNTLQCSLRSMRGKLCNQDFSKKKAKNNFHQWLHLCCSINKTFFCYCHVWTQPAPCQNREYNTIKALNFILILVTYCFPEEMD